MTALDIIQDSMETLGEAGVGEAISPEDGAYGLQRLNNMMANWSTRKVFVYTINVARYPLVAGTSSYAIGPTGVFAAPRPKMIATAQILILTGATYLSVKELEIISQEEYAELSDKTASAIVPEMLYNDNAWPNANLNLYPAPTVPVATQLELGTWTAMQNFPTLQTVFNMPDEYLYAISWNLAVELGPGYNKQPDQALAAKALEGMAAIQSLNATVMGADQGPQAGANTQPTQG